MLLLFLLLMTSGPKLQVSPHFGTAPRTVVMLLTDIPKGAELACFILDGTNYYGSCQYIDGRRSIRIEYKNVKGGEYTAAAAIDDKIVSEQPVTLLGPGGEPPMDNDFDGRDELVKKAYKNQSLVAKPPSQDDQVARYSDPWAPSPYSQFDDNKAGRAVLYDPCTEGIVGMRSWQVPVTGIKKHEGVAAHYEQFRMGWFEIIEIPDIDGTIDMVMRIMEPHETPEAH